jgi:F420-non-reducing hydrogenase large subunit
MAKTIQIQPVTRIEGHARVVIQLNDAGEVSDTKVHVMALRGFEKFCHGRPVEEMPRIVNRICGICPWNHHLASAKAADAVFGVTLPPTAVKLRRLAQHLAWIPDKLLNFYFLAAPDFVIGPTADPSVRNVVGIIQAAPDLAKKVVMLRQKGSMLLEDWLGKVIHPVAAAVGGFSTPLSAAYRDRIVAETKEQLEFALFTIKFAKENVFPKYLDAVKTLGVFDSGFLGTVTNDGTWDIYDGKLRMMKIDGSYEDFAYEQYSDHIAEAVEGWSYVKMPYAKKWGDGFSLDDAAPKGIYRANCLARINVCDRMPTPLAQKELEEFRAAFGRPAQLTLLYHWARLIELVANCEMALQLAQDPDILSKDVRADVTVKAGRGVGCVEAPRGTLIHDYTGDAQGFITDVNLIVGSTHNQAPINISVKKAAKAVIKGGVVDQGVLNLVEMAIRAYDP